MVEAELARVVAGFGGRPHARQFGAGRAAMGVSGGPGLGVFARTWQQGPLVDSGLALRFVPDEMNSEQIAAKQKVTREAGGTAAATWRAGRWAGELDTRSVPEQEPPVAMFDAMANRQAASSVAIKADGAQRCALPAWAPMWPPHGCAQPATRIVSRHCRMLTGQHAK